MPVTVRGTDILFNDGTTQSTAAGVPTVTAGTMYSSNWIPTAQQNYGTTYSLTTGRCYTTRVTVNGVIRVRFGIYSPESTGATTFGRIFKNGVAVGTERSTNQPGDVIFTEDLTFAVGDLLQIAVRNNNGNFMWGLSGGQCATGTSTAVVSNTGFNSFAV